MKLVSVIAFVNLIVLLSSCSQGDTASNSIAVSKSSIQDELDLFINSNESSSQDLSSLMDVGVEAVAVDVENIASAPDFQQSEELYNVPKSPELESLTTFFPPMKEDQVAHKSDDVLISELRTVIFNKDRKIQQLILENESLLLKLEERYTTKPTLRAGQQNQASNSFMNLQSEIAEVQANLYSKSSEFEELKIQKKILQDRIDSYELNTESPNSSFGNSEFADFQVSSPLLESKNNLNLPQTCQLSFDAVVTLQNGKSKEAFYTEFFLLDRNFGQILQDGSIFLSDYSSVSCFEELWAQSRKTPFMFPGLNKKIRALLQAEVSQGRGYRVRTDLDGAAILEDLPVRSYSLVGTASLGIVGVTWNLNIRLLEGSNNLSLTLANATWSK